MKKFISLLNRIGFPLLETAYLIGEYVIIDNWEDTYCHAGSLAFFNNEMKKDFKISKAISNGYITHFVLGKDIRSRRRPTKWNVIAFKEHPQAGEYMDREKIATYTKKPIYLIAKIQNNAKCYAEIAEEDLRGWN